MHGNVKRVVCYVQYDILLYRGSNDDTTDLKGVEGLGLGAVLILARGSSLLTFLS